MSRPVQRSFAVAFAGIATVFLLHLIGGVIPALAAWLAVPVLLLSAVLIGWSLERREERYATAVAEES